MRIICGRPFPEAPLKNAGGYTLVEIMIAMAIAALLMTSVFYAFSQNMDSWHRGEKKLALQSEISTIMYRIYYDLKRINPAIYYDQNFDLWVSGEKFKEAKPNEVELIDENQNRQDGFERIKFKIFMVEPFAKSQVIEFYLKKDPDSIETKYIKNKYGSANVLIRLCDGDETIISEHVEELKFKKEPSRISTLNVHVKVNMPPEYRAEKRTDFIDLKVKFDNDHITLREALASTAK
ncbi:MAG TPA: type II secretion system protein [Candidatus Wallbacteria bacterium]|nr:MAG: hypothetical protein BWY32_01563 [bacterium ADurb.Bin243]HOD39536.1 type II secretion system protein [Candidatus Wallbacteria bacterium]HPG56184.1 type II secretion system protein [Candidatus Wallbacteria bacterium]